MIRNLLLAILAVFTIQATAHQRHITIVISLDGCRWDYPLWYDTPTFDFMAEQGLEAGLIPAFPSKTFPNHYTLATGLYPDHHGIIANTFLDPESGEVFSLSNAEQKFNPKYYKGEPIWITAQRQGLRTAVFYWPGSDVEIMGKRPDTYYNYDAKPRLSIRQRIDGIIGQLSKPEDQRPQLIMAYLEQPDANGHRYGPQSKQTRHAVMMVDSLVGHLYNTICNHGLQQKVNVIVLSDHGMTWVDDSHRVPFSHLLEKKWVRDIQGNIPACIYANEGYADSIYHALQNLDHAKVWRKQDIPAYLHYGTSACIGDVVILPDEGYVAYDDSIECGGAHGYDPDLQDMHAMFRAIGPDIPHQKLAHFPNVNVYSLLCRLLGIEPASNDGELPFNPVFKQ